MGRSIPLFSPVYIPGRNNALPGSEDVADVALNKNKTPYKTALVHSDVKTEGSVGEDL